MTDTSTSTPVPADDTPTSTPVPADVTFADFDVHPDIVASLADAGITSPFPIQAMTLPVALSGHDIIGQAKTGTGKTLGFGVPMLNRTIARGDAGWDDYAYAGKPQALAVAPTRELAVQVAGDLEKAGKRRGIRVLTVYGGRAYEPQIDALAKGVEVVVGTPGRLIDLAKQGHLDLSHVKSVVLDEADEMLDLGFLPDVEKLLALTPGSRQTMLFSATMPGAVVALARRYMSQPTHIRAMGDDQENAHTVKAVEQFVYRAHAMDKVEMLARMLQAEGRGLTIVFSRTKRTAAKVADELVDRGFAAAAIHGDLGQGAREQALRAFRSGKVDVLVATDVAARGIDVTDVTHVINYQCPEDSKTYVHRIGRTGRAGKTGVAVTLVDWDELHRWKTISDDLGLDKPEAPETYSTSDHLYTDLDIPTNAKGRLPHSQRTRAGLDAEYVDTEGDHGGRSKPRNRRDGRDGRGARAEDVVVPRRTRTPRTRSRTRGGAAAEGGSEGTSPTASTSEATTAPTTGPASEAGTSAESGEGGAPRRRRRRGGRRRSGGSEQQGEAVISSDAAAS